MLLTCCRTRRKGASKSPRRRRRPNCCCCSCCSSAAAVGTRKTSEEEKRPRVSRSFVALLPNTFATSESESEVFRRRSFRPCFRITSLQREAIYIVTWLDDDDDDDDDEDDSEMDLGSSSYSSDLEKRVLGKSMSGGMDGSCRELRDENHEIRLAQLHVQITHPPSPCKSPSRE